MDCNESRIFAVKSNWWLDYKKKPEWSKFICKFLLLKVIVWHPTQNSCENEDLSVILGTLGLLLTCMNVRWIKCNIFISFNETVTTCNLCSCYSLLLYICLYIFVYTCIYTYIYIFIYMYVCMYVQPNRTIPIQSTWSMALSAMTVECEWFVYLFIHINYTATP